MSDDQVLNVRCRDQRGDELSFKVKKETKFSKIFAAYASQKGIDPASLTFLFDGNRIGPDTTPKMLEMEDGDLVEVNLAQVGGGCGK